MIVKLFLIAARTRSAKIYSLDPDAVSWGGPGGGLPWEGMGPKNLWCFRPSKTHEASS